MSDCEYLTFCPHCECNIPSRTFRDHRERFFDIANNTWERDTNVSSDVVIDSDDDEMLFNTNTEQQPVETGGGCDLISSSEEDQTCESFGMHLLDREVWDEVCASDVDDDFPQKNGTLPNVNVRINSRPRTINLHLSRCLIVLLAYFWLCFHISDNGMDFLLSGIKRCFEVAGMSSQWMAGLALAFPGTLYYFRKELGLVNDVFVKYVVCPKCHSLYEFDKCYRTVGTTRISNKCSNVKFTNHRQRWRRQPCGAPLLKEVTLKCGSKRLYPHRIYCYKSIVESLRMLVKRPDFTAHCELWRNREVRSVSQVMCDVFDGRIWRDFHTVNGVPFLSAPRNYGLMLNVDWFQPFKHTIYSVGVIYLVIMNLPRSERFKPENVILVGLIPGPNELV